MLWVDGVAQKTQTQTQTQQYEQRRVPPRERECAVPVAVVEHVSASATGDQCSHRLRAVGAASFESMEERERPAAVAVIDGEVRLKVALEGVEAGC